MAPGMDIHQHCTLLGADGLSDQDLLILTLGADRPPLRRAIAALTLCFPDLADLAEAPVEALMEAGLSWKRAVRLHAALGIGRRSARRRPPDTLPVRSAAEAALWFLPALRGLGHEELHALYLDRRGRPLCYRRLSSGSDAATVVDPRQILRPAVAVGAACLIIGHNHPSHDPEPSREDLLATRRLAAACAALGVRLHDHLIIGGERYVSLLERGEIAPGAP